MTKPEGMTKPERSLAEDETTPAEACSAFFVSLRFSFICGQTGIESTAEARQPRRSEPTAARNFALGACSKNQSWVAQATGLSRPATRRTEWRQPFEIMDATFSRSSSPQFRSAGRRPGRAGRPRHPFLGSALRRFFGFRHSSFVISLCLLFLLTTRLASDAVLFYSTADPSYNTNSPSGTLTNSGWQFQGAWVGFSGTVISSNCFITAKHVGGTVGEAFVFRGVSYPTTASFDATNADLTIWRVSGQFPTNAPLYTKNNEWGKPLVVIGRGGQRGAPVLVNNRLRGWQWGTWDSVQRWGQNHVSGIVDGGAGFGQLLQGSFNPGGHNEADLSGGDSGGAVYIKDGKSYKLAGINYSVTGPYNTTNSGPGFDAAIFNQHGLYGQNNAGTWTLIRTGPVAGNFYATRISSRINWIKSVLDTPGQ